MDSTVESPDTVVRIKSPGELFAALPYLFGFRPEDSVVLLANAGPGRELGKRLRADLPISTDLVDPLSVQMAAAMAMDRPASVLILVVGGSDDGLRTKLITMTRRELRIRGVECREAYWTPAIDAGSEWRCLDGNGVGTLPDPKSTVVAAQLASSGFVAYESRSELGRLYAADDGCVLAARAELIRAESARRPSRSDGVAAIRRALTAARSAVPVLSDRQLAQIAVALTESAVRDGCMSTAIPAGSPGAVAAERLWQALTRSLPAPERAEAACLAAFAAYMRGDGAAAGIAFELASAADESHVLTALLTRALSHGMHPDRLRGLATHDEVGLCVPSSAAA